MSLSITGVCNLDIYILNLSSLAKGLLYDLCSELPVHCIVLLEDIDTINTVHSRLYRTVTPGQDDTTSPVKEKLEGTVSLSVLLNIIDSIGS